MFEEVAPLTASAGQKGQVQAVWDMEWGELVDVSQSDDLGGLVGGGILHQT